MNVIICVFDGHCEVRDASGKVLCFADSPKAAYQYCRDYNCHVCYARIMEPITPLVRLS